VVSERPRNIHRNFSLRSHSGHPPFTQGFHDRSEVVAPCGLEVELEVIERLLLEALVIGLQFALMRLFEWLRSRGQASSPSTEVLAAA